MHPERELAPGVRLLPLRTPTLPPASATNTLVIGRRRLAVIEPATPHADEQARLAGLLEALARAGGELVAILVTHHHVDHIGHVEGLARRTGAPIYAHAATTARVPFAVDHALADGDTLELDDGFALSALFTPGHAPGHLVYLERRTRIAHAGDMVAGEGTILIDPEDDGDMGAYLRSLERLGACGARRLVPAHGPVIDDPGACVRHYIDHRLARERRVLAGLEEGPVAFDALLAAAYADTPRALWPLASRSLRAHLDKLEREGVVRTRDRLVELAR